MEPDQAEPTVDVEQINLEQQITSVVYQRLVNLGNYENEKIGISAAVRPGQDPNAVYEECKAWVSKRANEYRDLQQEVHRLREEKWQMARDIRNMEVAKERAIEGLKKIAAILRANGHEVPNDLLEYIGESPQESLLTEDDEDYDEGVILDDDEEEDEDWGEES